MVMETLKRAARAALAAMRPSTEELRNPQTAGLASLHREWASHPARGMTPSKLNAVLDAAEQGDLIAQYELFEDMEERDGHIASEFSKRRRALLGIDWDVVPPPNASSAEKKAAAKVKEVLEALPFETILYDVTDAIGKGFACLELQWARLDGLWTPQHADHRPQTWFLLHRGDLREEIRLRDYSAEGAPLRPFGWICHTHKARSGYLARANMFRALVWPYLFKNYSVGDLAEFLEIYGIPLRVGKYPPGASEPDKRTLLRALASIGHNAAGIIPDGMALEFHDAATGDPDSFLAMIDWCERTQSKVILGGTLTSQADRGSNTNALGNVHNEVRHDIRDSDARQIETTLTRDLVLPIALLNGWAATPTRAPRFKLQTQEPEDITVLSSALPALVNLGVRVPRQWAQEKLGIPEPEGDEDVLGAVPEPEDGTEDPAPAPPANRAAASAELTNTGDVVAQAVDHVDGRLDGVLASWVDQVKAHMSDAGDLESFRDTLIDVLPALLTNLVARELAQAMAVAWLAGRASIADIVAADAAEPRAAASSQAGAGIIQRGWSPAAEYFMQKVNLPTQRWDDIWQGEHARAFVVAGAMREDLLTELRGAVESAIVQGTSFEVFQERFEEIVGRLGWTGWTGEGTAAGRAWRARVIYKTNLLTAHAAGRYRQMTDPDTLAHMPYWQYRHNTLENPREVHQAWNGLVLRWDDPWWKIHYPPNGWGCRCDVRPVSERMLRKMGKDGPDASPAPIDGDPPPEWAYNVGEAAWGKPVAESIITAERGGKMVALDQRGAADFGRADVPFDTPQAPPLPGRIADPQAVREAFRRSVGGDAAVLSDPAGARINLTQALVEHWIEDPKRMQGREQYLPLLPELIERPFEVWAAFARNELTGKVELRRRYVKGVQVGKERYLGLVADAVSGQWVGLTLFVGGTTALNNLRRGLLLWGRG